MKEQKSQSADRSDFSKPPSSSSVLVAVLLGVLASPVLAESESQAIIGSGTDAIVGSGKPALIVDKTFGPIVSGPVTAVHSQQRTMDVMGQEVRIIGSTNFDGLSLDSLQVGDWATVTGLSKGNQLFASTVVSTGEVFVPGVSTVFVSGDVLALDASKGFFSVGDIAVYAAGIDAASWAQIQIGDYVEVFGTLPQSGQPITATDVTVTNAIVGSGKQAIVGSGKQAIVGSGKQAIVGSGTDAIVGSGKQAIVGSGTDAIVGSGTE
jgi:hypothetical protein